MALPVNGSTHLIPAYYSFIDPERMKNWVGLVGWPVADGLPTLVWSPISCRSSAGQRKFAGQRPTFYHCATPPRSKLAGHIVSQPSRGATCFICTCTVQCKSKMTPRGFLASDNIPLRMSFSINLINLRWRTADIRSTLPWNIAVFDFQHGGCPPSWILKLEF